MRHLILIVFLCYKILFFLPIGNASSVSLYDEKRFQEAVSLIARGVLDLDYSVVIGESRNDFRHRLDHDFPRLEAYEIADTLFLKHLYPLTVLRGTIDENIIWVENKIMNPVSSSPRLHFPILSGDGVWLCFIRPVSNLPDTMAQTQSELNKKIRELDKSTTPFQFIDQLGIQSWLNEKTWFSLREHTSAFSVNVPVRNLDLPDHIGEITRQSLEKMNEQGQVLAAASPELFTKFTLTVEDLSEIIELVKLFNSVKAIPTVDELVAMQSIYADAVLRELSSIADEDLSDSLIKLRDEIPDTVLDRIQKYPAAQ